MRKKWVGPRSEVFLSLHSAERRLEKLRNAWHGPDGPNPLLWTQIETARVRWEGGEMDKWPYSWHPPVKKRKGRMENLRPIRACRKCAAPIQESEPGIWKNGGFNVCPIGGYHEPA